MNDAEALNKQHDAMSQAMKLATRNEELEKELKDIDHVALAVEADCNSAVKENNRRVCRLQVILSLITFISENKISLTLYLHSCLGEIRRCHDTSTCLRTRINRGASRSARATSRSRGMQA